MKEIIKGEITFVRILLPLVIGICLAFLFTPAASWLVIIFSNVLLFLLFTYAVISYRLHLLYKQRWLPGFLFHIFIFVTGFLITVLESQKLDDTHFSATKFDALVINIKSEPRISAQNIRFEAAIEQGYRAGKFYKAIGRIIVSLRADSNYREYLQYGDLLLIPAKYEEVAPPFNPAEFNFKNYLANHSIYHQSYLSQTEVQILKKGMGSPVIAFALKLRQDLVRAFNRHIHNKDAAALASTLILGYRADLSSEVIAAYSATGTMHVLSVSGMHVGIVFFVLSFLLQFMDKNKSLRLWRALIMILLIWIYALITGFSPSVCRAALMLTIVVAGKAVHRQINNYNLLAASAVLLLLYNPFFLVDVGFQLSYLAVAGLIYFYPKLYHLFNIENWLGDKLWSSIALSTAAQVATFPVSVYYFHQFPLCFLISNIFILLPVTFIMYAGLLFILLPIDFVRHLLGWLLEKTIQFTNRGLLFIENIPYANITGIWVSTIFYTLIYILIFLVLFAFLYNQKKLIAAAAIVSLVLSGMYSARQVSAIDQKQVIFYSLNKNSAVGFFNGNTACVLTDLSNKDKNFSYAVRPSLDSQCVKNVHYILPGKAFQSHDLFTDGNFLQFRNWKMLVYDKTLNNKKYKAPMFVDAVLLRNNPALKISSLISWLHFGEIYADGSNTAYRIKQWQEEARQIGCKFYVLKKNRARIIKL